MQTGGIAHGTSTSTTAAAPKDLAHSVWSLIWANGLVGRCPGKVHRSISDRCADDVCPVSCDLLISSAVAGHRTHPNPALGDVQGELAYTDPECGQLSAWSGEGDYTPPCGPSGGHLKPDNLHTVDPREKITRLKISIFI